MYSPLRLESRQHIGQLHPRLAGEGDNARQLISSGKFPR